ncbi:zinc finger and BTB domain-containing protein 49 isoform X1 [Aplysia californica]|uniref:Zinc finger and BTB domain-containing protein 49 isoform X1 n=1 Tax=Aplysia californica TaxID=6500 RepID=A0ABM1A5U1_APLCA|nr:zinc finger and BTB domain-containing protein 49 isoform X1 [Aplysia californica]
MPELPLDVAVANRFISSLSKSLQALCHGCMDFDSGIEIVGYINVNIDCGSKVDYVLNEKVLKSTTNSMTFVSNSFLAKKDQPKQTRDGSCSPVAELQVQSFPSSSRHRGAHPYPGALHHRSAFPYSQTHALRGAQKRAWSGMERDWRASPRKHSRGGRGSYPLPHEQPYGGSSSHTSSFETQSSQVPSTSDSSFLQPEIPVSNSGVNIKKELFDSEDQSGAGQSEAGVAGESEGGNGDSSLDSKLNIKADPDAVPESEGDPSAGPSEDANTDLKDTFLQQSGEDAEQPEPGDSAQDAEGEFPSFDMAQSESAADNGQTMSEDTTAGAEQTDDNVTAENSEAPAEYDEAGDDMSYPQSSYAEQGEGSGDGGQFEVIEIDDEDEDVQAMFGDAQAWCYIPSRDEAESSNMTNRPIASCRSYSGAQMPSSFRSENVRGMHQSQAAMPYSGSGSFQVQCRICAQVFSHSTILKSHIYECHPREAQNAFPYVCSICQKGFFSHSGLTHHSEKHSAKFECYLCSKTFSYSRNLKRHQEINHSLKECRYCKRLFKVGEELNHHVLSCSGANRS